MGEYLELLVLLRNSFWAAAILGLLGGLISVLVQVRDSSFALHGISELSFAGAAIGLLAGIGVTVGAVAGSLAAAALIAFFGSGRRSTFTAVLMPFGLGIGILALSLYPGRSSNKFGLLVGQIVAVDNEQLSTLITLGLILLAALVLLWRPLLFSSADPAGAAARGWNLRLFSLIFMIILGLAVAVAVQIVGALLVMSVLVTPAAAALQISKSPGRIVILSMLFGVVSMVGGMALSLLGSLPVSPYITTIAFGIYALCALWGWLAKKRFLVLWQKL